MGEQAAINVGGVPLVHDILYVVVILTGVLVLLLLPAAAGVWAALKHAYKSYPRDQRWAVIGEILRAVFKRHKRVGRPLTEEEARFRRPDDPVRTVPFDQWYRLDTLVKDPVRLTTPEIRTWAAALDVDGSVAMLRQRDDLTSDITVLSPDGTRRAITGPDGVVSAWPPAPSIDRGTLAWWHVALDGKSAQLWVSEPAAPGPRVLHTEQTPTGRSAPMCPYGWVCAAGDRIAWTMLSGGTGVIGVTSLDGTTYRLGPTKYPTVHRDRAAELQGRRVVAVNLDTPGFTSTGQIAEIDLDAPSPALRVIKAEAFPGGSACLGSAVGFWRTERVLQLPGGLGVPMPAGSIVSDITTDGEWVGATVLRSDGTGRPAWVQEVFHVPTGAIHMLGGSHHGVVDIRAGRVLWSSGHEGWPSGSVTSWVGELQAPRVTGQVASS